MEALVWNNTLWMQRGVGIAGNGMSLLNGHTAKRDSMALLERGGGGVVYKGGV
jgi:hypothetical protein